MGECGLPFSPLIYKHALCQNIYGLTFAQILGVAGLAESFPILLRNDTRLYFYLALLILWHLLPEQTEREAAFLKQSL